MLPASLFRRLLFNAFLSQGSGEGSRVSTRASWGEVLLLAAVRVLVSGLSVSCVTSGDFVLEAARLPEVTDPAERFEV